MRPYHIGHRINILGRMLSKRLQEKITRAGISSSQWPVIARLLYCEELTQTEICSQLSIEAPAISKTIGNLEAAGWVRRYVDNADKREKKVTLTAKAKATMPTWLELIKEMEEEWLEGISDEDFEVFNSVLEQLLKTQKNF